MAPPILAIKWVCVIDIARTIEQIAEDIGMLFETAAPSIHTIQRDISFLISAGVLIKERRGNDATYQVAPKLLKHPKLTASIENILDEGFEVIKEGFKNQKNIRNKIIEAMSPVIDWRKRAEESFQKKYASYRINNQHISPPQEAKELLKALHDLEWLELPFTQKGGPGGRIIYSFNMPKERIKIVVFKADDVLEDVDRFIRDDLAGLSQDQQAAIVATNDDILDKLRKNDELQPMLEDGRIFIVRLEENSYAAKQWSALIGDEKSYNFKAMSVTQMVNNIAFLQALAKAK